MVKRFGFAGGSVVTSCSSEPKLPVENGRLKSGTVVRWESGEPGGQIAAERTESGVEGHREGRADDEDAE